MKNTEQVSQELEYLVNDLAHYDLPVRIEDALKDAHRVIEQMRKARILLFEGSVIPPSDDKTFVAALDRVQAELIDGVSITIADDGLTLNMGGNRYAVDGDGIIIDDTRNRSIYDQVQAAIWLEKMRLVDA